MRVHFGGNDYTITRAKWSSEFQMGIVTFEDQNGVEYTTEALGLAPNEQRQAVVDCVMQRWYSGKP